MKVKLKRDQVNKLFELTKGHTSICGIDEVGRGPIAGPVVSCSVIMDTSELIDEIKDSKKLTDKKRRELAKKIEEKALAIGYGIVDAKTIDEINIRQATLLSMQVASETMVDKKGKIIKPDLLLIDAELIDSDRDQIAIISGDDLVYSISCASILAKVYRDDIMIAYGESHPEYKFENHKGYGTKAHYQALEEYGSLDIHRESFLGKFYEKLNKDK